jgi:ABC-type multidrug transport system fused ATPase/permease subunit
MINAERCMNLCNIIQEREFIGEQAIVDQAWPQKGEIEFRNVSLRYRP